MDLTRPANFIGKPDRTYGLVAFLSPEAQKQVQDIILRLTDSLPGVVWTMPPEALHITLFELMQRSALDQAKKDELYRKFGTDWERELGAVLANVSPITLHFSEIEASADAIIIRCPDAEKINEIRKQISETLLLPASTKLPPDIVHCSIARFVQAVPLAQVQDVLRGFQIAVDETIANSILVKTSLQPMLEYEVLKAYS